MLRFETLKTLRKTEYNRPLQRSMLDHKKNRLKVQIYDKLISHVKNTKDSNRKAFVLENRFPSEQLYYIEAFFELKDTDLEGQYVYEIIIEVLKEIKEAGIQYIIDQKDQKTILTFYW